MSKMELFHGSDHVIEKADLCIRNADVNDCAQLAKWWNDSSVMAHAGFPNGLGTTAEQIQEQIAHDSDDSKRRLITEEENESRRIVE